jgi:hypothetical protein
MSGKKLFLMRAFIEFRRYGILDREMERRMDNWRDRERNRGI